MREYQKHIRHPNKDQKGNAICGVKLAPFDWAFTDIDHAWCSTQVSYVQPCPACAKAIIDVFSRAE